MINIHYQSNVREWSITQCSDFMSLMAAHKEKQGGTLYLNDVSIGTVYSDGDIFFHNKELKSVNLIKFWNQISSGNAGESWISVYTGEAARKKRAEKVKTLKKERNEAFKKIKLISKQIHEITQEE